MESPVIIIGGGLAGSAAALELASRKINVNLFEMRPVKMTQAHSGDGLAELVCSNSMGSRETFSANGLLMNELEKINCQLLKIALRNAVPAGRALAVDRKGFEKDVTDTIENEPYINLKREETTSIPSGLPIILASGPLTSDPLVESLKTLIGDDGLYFFDATSPTVTLESLDMSRAFWANRRDSTGQDYLNCPMEPDEFKLFYEALITAERVEIRDFETDKLFESCLPIEIIGSRNPEAMRFGPMKPVGLRDPETGKGFYAVVQLRRENMDGSLLNLVGFQTRLKYPEQKRVFRMIPALKNAEFTRFGHMHRNFFIDARKHLDEYLRLKTAPNIYLAGQITGGEGYLEAVAQGTLAGVNIARELAGKPPVLFPPETMLGAFPILLVGFEGDNYQPLKVSFGMLPELEKKVRGKRPRREKQTERAFARLSEFVSNNEI